MTKRELIKQLNNLCELMNYEYSINCGGCCYVAAVIAEQLERFDIPYVTAVTFRPTHYAIKVKDGYINRDDFNFLKSGEFHQDWDSKKLYLRYKDNMGYWNDEYNRRWNLIVKTRITALFNKYGNSRT